MSETDIGSAVASDLKTAFASGTDNYYSVDAQHTDAGGEQKEFK